MSVSVDICWKSFNKNREELCGDKVEVLKTEDSSIIRWYGKWSKSEYSCNSDV